MPWKPGQSGNPGGRSKIKVEIEQLARNAGPQAIAALVQALKDPRLKVAAATAILERGFGKPVQTVNANVNILDELPDDDRRRIIGTLKAIAGVEGEAADSSGTTGPLH